MRRASLVGVVVLFMGCAASKEPAKSADVSSAEAGDAAGAPPPPAQPGYAQPAPGPAQDGVSSGDKDLSTIEAAEQALADDLATLDAAFSEATALSAGGDSCNRVCRAIGSMRRSVDAICRLAGDEDDRCKNARDSLDKNNKRVSDSGCGC